MGNQNNNEGKFLERLSIFISNMIISVITVMTVAVIPSRLFVRDTGWEPDVPPCGGDGYQGNDSVQCECRLQKKTTAISAELSKPWQVRLLCQFVGKTSAQSFLLRKKRNCILLPMLCIIQKY